MNFGQQIIWIDGANKAHKGTVVANGGGNPQVWGVSNNLQPNQNTKPDLWVKQDGQNFRMVQSQMTQGQAQNQGIPSNAYEVSISQQLYGNAHMRDNGRFTSEKVHVPVKSVGLGTLAYRKSFQQKGELR